MVTNEQLINATNSFFDGDYEIIQGRTIPRASDLQFGKTGKLVDLAMLFIDLHKSTKIVDGFRLQTAAKMYQSFLYGITQISLRNNGEVRSFNGDGVLVTFYGDTMRNSAVKAALQMSYFVKKILRPKIHAYFSRNTQLQNLNFNFGIGIDHGKVLVVRGGIRGENNNDLVWISNATNYAVKLSELAKTPTPLPVLNVATKPNIFITNRVYNALGENLKFIKNPIVFGIKTPIWQKVKWNEELVYKTSHDISL